MNSDAILSGTGWPPSAARAEGGMRILILGALRSVR
jgi:hypothetical protein